MVPGSNVLVPRSVWFEMITVPPPRQRLAQCVRRCFFVRRVGAGVRIEQAWKNVRAPLHEFGVRGRAALAGRHLAAGKVVEAVAAADRRRRDRLPLEVADVHAAAREAVGRVVAGELRAHLGEEARRHHLEDVGEEGRARLRPGVRGAPVARGNHPAEARDRPLVGLVEVPLKLERMRHPQLVARRPKGGDNLGDVDRELRRVPEGRVEPHDQRRVVRLAARQLRRPRARPQ
eukprot:5745755-Prymnesium_polylepis.1